MKKRQLILLIAIALVSGLLVNYSNCTNQQTQFQKIQGTTGTGNPFNGSTELLAAICTILTRCDGNLDFNTCINGVTATSGIGPTIGLSG